MEQEMIATEESEDRTGSSLENICERIRGDAWPDWWNCWILLIGCHSQPVDIDWPASFNIADGFGAAKSAGSLGEVMQCSANTAYESPTTIKKG